MADVSSRDETTEAAYSENPDRWNPDAFHHPDKKINSSITRGAHFLKQDVSAFDANFFSIPKAEAEAIDPQQRMLIETAYEAIENSGLSVQKIAGTRTGVFVGNFTSDYRESILKDPESGPTYAINGACITAASNRISWFFDLKGPSFTLDTACSSGLVAVHQACQSLMSGDSDIALVGAESLLLNPDMFGFLSNQQFLAKDGKCKAFDESGDGYGRGEGIAVLVLRRVDDAIADGDPIRAIIRGSACNQDGRTKGLTMPSADAQEQLALAAYSAADLSPSETRYVEAHGTGTQAGDTQETLGLSRVFSPHRSSSDKLFLGSVKTNIGHLEACAGLASLIKVIFILEQGQIPPNISFKIPNPKIDWDDWKLHVPTELTPWPTNGLRRASAQAFGYGGTNAHVILDDAYHYLESRGLTGNHYTKTYSSKRKLQNNGSKNHTPRLFALSAQDKEGLKRVKSTLADHLSDLANTERNNEKYMRDLAHTLNERRSHLQWQTYAIGFSAEDLADALRDSSSTALETRRREKPRLGFIFTGQGAQWPRMGVELMAFDVFRRSVEDSDRYLSEELGCPWSAIEELAKDTAESSIGLASHSQTLCTVLQVGLVDLLESWNIRPEAVTGHSSGEIGAAYCLGSLSKGDALKVAYYRGILSSGMKEVAPDVKGCMAAIGASPEQAQKWMDELTKGEVVVACVNSPSSVTASGDAEAVEELVEKLSSTGVFARKLKVDTAYHSPHMQMVAAQYFEALADVKPRAAKAGRKMYSAVLGGYIEPGQLGASNWVRNLVSPVQFSDALHDLMRPSINGKRASVNSVDMLVEIGPSAALQGPIKQTLQAYGVTNVDYRALLARGQDGVQTALACVGALLVQGVSVNTRAVNRDEDPSASPAQLLVDLPPYAWNRATTYWAESRLVRETRLRSHPRQPLLGAPCPAMDTHARHWRGFVRLSEEPWLRDHQIQGAVLYPAAGFLAMAIEAAAQTADPTRRVHAFRLRDITIDAALVVPDDDDSVEVILELRPHLHATLDSAATWTEFTITSSDNAKDLRKNCSGLIVVEYEAPVGSSMTEERELARQTAKLEFAKLNSTAHNTLGHDELYAHLQGLGLSYGPAFARIKEVRLDQTKSGWCVGDIENTAVSSLVPPYRSQRPHIIHPTTLDAVFHLAFAALKGSSEELVGAMVPTKIDQVVVSPNAPWQPGSVLHGLASARRHGFKELVADIDVIDTLSVKGFTCSDVSGNAGRLQGDDIRARQIATAIKWMPAVDLLTLEELRTVLCESSSVESQLDLFIDLLHTSNPGLSVLEVTATGESLLARSPVFHRLCETADIQICVPDDTAAASLEELAKIVALKVGAPDSLPAGTFDLIVAPANTSGPLRHLLKEHGKLCLVGVSQSALDLPGTVLNARPDLCIAGLPASQPLRDIGSEAILLVSSEASEGARAVAAQLSALLESNAIAVRTVIWGSSDQSTAVQSRACVVLAELDTPLLSQLSEQDFTAVKFLVENAKTLVWATALDTPDAVVVNGLARSVRNEIPGIQLRTLQLSQTSLTAPKLTAALLSRVLRAEVLDDEFEASTDGILKISRIEPSPLFNDNLAHLLPGAPDQLVKIPLSQASGPQKLCVRTVGMLDSLAFERDTVPDSVLEEGMIEVQMKAISLNFREVMVALGQIPDSKLGFDGAGVVNRLGPGVTKFKVGDNVCVFGHGAHRTVHRCRADYCELIPEGLSFEEAATLPLVHGTAWYGIVKLAQAQPGQSILIHAAAGGVGQAAIQLAKHIGMEIFATVSSAEKRELIQDKYGVLEDHIFNSRDLSFADGIKRMTGGRGVDVVLNSLTGEALQQSWYCVAPFGHFIEIGMKDLLVNSRLDMRPFLQDATYVFFNMNRIENHRPELMAEIMSSTFELLRSGVTKPVYPVTTYPISQVEDAFRSMQTGKLTGKIVLSVSDTDIVTAIQPSALRLSLHSDATYILVGGLGGLGRSLAKLLVLRGARNLCFLSRSGAATKDAQRLVTELEQAGVRVKVAKCDVANAIAVDAVVKDCNEQLGAVRGVIQCAMVLRDGLFQNMKYRDWVESTQPKIQGSWNLHQSLGDVDFFITLSSFAGVFGSRGQSNYAAAGAFEDALAYHRRAHGLNATTLDLGIMREIGVLAEKGITEYLREWDEPFGINEAEFHALIENTILAGNSVDAQIPTGFATAGSSAAAGITPPFYLEDPRFSILANTGRRSALSSGDKSVSWQDEMSAAGSPAAAAEIVTAALVARLAKSLQMNAADIDTAKPLHAYGVDSLVAVEIANWIFKDLKASVAVFDILGSMPMTSLALKVAERSSAVKKE
ncbi:hypothetical protein N0V95_002038 [Ascochyta clinopodiicola]|nr:hypothetical protein N0V95_002038 [Ascochyta clinopodiicola]